MAEHTRTILVVDHEPSERQLLAGFVASLGFRVKEVGSGEAALEYVRENPIDMILIEVRMPQMNGIETLAEVRKIDARLPALLIAGHADLPQATAALQGEADDCLAKPVDLDELEAAISDAVGSNGGPLGSQRRHAPELPAEIVCHSAAMRHVVETAAAVAASSAAVLILGEAGVGKEVMAQLIHRFSPRAAGPMVAANCAELPEKRIESELFGHTKGAFTGAGEARQGLFRAADGGTLFLDEIDATPLDVQARLLQALETGQIVPVGSDNPIAVNTRVIAATERDLGEAVAAGHFLGDLYEWINVVELVVPPLAQRREDILPLARRFATEFAGTPVRLSPRAMRRLLAYRFPGNVRELLNTMQRACLSARGDVIMPEDLPPKIASPDEHDAAAGAPGGRPSHIERATIQTALAQCNGNRTRAAKTLGMSRREFIRKLRTMEGK